MEKSIVKNYINLFSNLSPDNINEFDNLISKDIIFADPFNNIKGKNAFKNIFYHMFENVKEPSFFVLDYSINKQRVFLKWKMTFFAFKSLQTIEGMSELLLNDNGKVASHIDYWDTLNGLFIKIPFIGYFYKISLFLFKIKS
ncbi:nuclear transport factor 2 family protein [bacterium]|nr:nuclear transport factor 2 family protein [bacterium]